MGKNSALYIGFWFFFFSLFWMQFCSIINLEIFSIRIFWKMNQKKCSEIKIDRIRLQYCVWWCENKNKKSKQQVTTRIAYEKKIDMVLFFHFIIRIDWKLFNVWTKKKERKPNLFATWDQNQWTSSLDVCCYI